MLQIIIILLLLACYGGYKYFMNDNHYTETCEEYCENCGGKVSIEVFTSPTTGVIFYDGKCNYCGTIIAETDGY